MIHLLQNLQASERAICQIWSALVETNNEGKDITKLIMDYTKEAKTRDSLVKTLINAHESEISRLKMEGSHDQLSKQKCSIREEMKVLEGLCNTNIRDGSSHEAYDSVSPCLFKEFKEAVQERCPLIHEVIETLVVPLHKPICTTATQKQWCTSSTLLPPGHELQESCSGIIVL